MDEVVTPSRSKYRKLLYVVPILLLVIFLGKCAADKFEQRRIDEEIATAEGLAKVVSETFKDEFEVKVANVSGMQDVTSVNYGWLFKTKQRALLPYSVDYFLNLSKLDRSDLRFNPTARVLVVRVPEVTVAQPNVDEAKIKILNREGWFRSTKAGENLARRASKLAERGARKSASDPAKLEKAREHARTKIGTLLRLPLESAGLQDVKVVIHFPTEGNIDPSYLDLSVPYEEAIREAQRRRAGEVAQ